MEFDFFLVMESHEKSWNLNFQKEYEPCFNLHVFESLTVAIDNIHFLTLVELWWYFNLLNVSLKDVCNISDNKFALQIRKNIFFSMFIF